MFTNFFVSMINEQELSLLRAAFGKENLETVREKVELDFCELPSKLDELDRVTTEEEDQSRAQLAELS